MLRKNLFHNNKKSESKKIEESKVSDNVYTTPILYPDSRFIKTNTVCPSMRNVMREKNWSEFDQL